MEQQDRDPDEGKESGEQRSPRAGRAQGGGPQVIATDDPALLPEPASNPDWMDHPDQTLAIETSRIRGPSEAFHPNFVMVPVEVERARNGRSDSGDKGKKGDEGGKDKDNPEDEGRNDDQDGGAKGGKGEDAKSRKDDSDSENDDDKGGKKSGDRGKGAEKGKSPPSLWKTLLFSGIVALVCGVLGAWAYSALFGSSKSGDQSSSGKGSGSGKGGGSGKGSDSGQDSGSETSQNDPDQGKIREAEAAWMMAVKELRAAEASAKSARHSEEEAKSILSFLKRTLLTANRPVDASLAEAFWAGGPVKDVSLRKAVDLTESQVAETFADRPPAEAAVREMLGLAYLSLGDPAQAVKQYERALALRQANQGAQAPETAACRNQLAVAYRLAGRTVEAARLFERDTNSPAYASTLAVSGSMLLARKNPADAELKLRECLTIRRKIQPDDWTTFETKSVLGEALLDQGRFAEAETFLISGYEGMKQREGAIPPQDRPRLTQALERLVRLYEAWGKKVETTRWRKELAGARI